MVREDKRKPMLTLVDSLAEVMFKFTNIVMLFAPFGVGAAIAYTVGHTGLGVLANLAKLLATLYIALTDLPFWRAAADCAAVFQVCPSGNSLRAVAEPASIAFGTRQFRSRSAPGPWKRWNRSACRVRSWPSSCRRATASISTAPAFINRWEQYS